MRLVAVSGIPVRGRLHISHNTLMMLTLLDQIYFDFDGFEFGSRRSSTLSPPYWIRTRLSSWVYPGCDEIRLTETASWRFSRTRAHTKYTRGVGAQGERVVSTYDGCVSLPVLFRRRLLGPLGPIWHQRGQEKPPENPSQRTPQNPADPSEPLVVSSVWGHWGFGRWGSARVRYI